MLVALVFTMVLMAGMAAVFKASLSTLFTSGESLSSARRNRMSIDLMGVDLDTACMYLQQLTGFPPMINAANPAFYVEPNMPIANLPATHLATDPTSADELFFYLDQPLAFQGTVVTPAAPNGQGVLNAGPAGNTFVLDCVTNTNALQVTAGTQFVVEDIWEAFQVAAVNGVNGSQVTVTIGPGINANVSYGPNGSVTNSHAIGATVMFYLPSQMVRYSVQYLKLDPNAADSNLIPCLVRDQGPYNTAAFAATLPQQIITENVQAFKVYLSVSPNLVNVNSAAAWAGVPPADPGNPGALPLPRSSGWTGLAGWNSGILGTTAPDAASITTQVATASPNATLPANDVDWFRDIPTLVRVDVTTRTAAQRTEYAAAANTAAFKTLTQSLMFVPRHSGLQMNSN
jgi:hypothetical protein